MIMFDGDDHNPLTAVAIAKMLQRHADLMQEYIRPAYSRPASRDEYALGMLAGLRFSVKVVADLVETNGENNDAKTD